MYTKKIFVAGLLITASLALNAQTATVSAGGEAKSAAGSVSYSVGQVAYSSVSNTSGSVSQGVQQTYQVSTAGVLEERLDFSLSVFPNPTTNQITLEVGKFENQPLNYVLFDAAGKQIQANKVLEKQTNVDMSTLPNATYLMDVYQDNKKVQTFKILKVN